MINMCSYGKEETKVLKKNLENQLERLVQQLEDLDGCREELDPAEYEETKRDTIDQMKELDESLQRILSGDMTLVDDLGAMQLAIHAAISKSFEASTVIRMLGKEETKQFQETSTSLQRNAKFGKITDINENKSLETLNAPNNLDENLSLQKLEMLNSLSYSNVDAEKYVPISDYVERDHDALAIASQELRANRNF